MRSPSTITMKSSPLPLIACLFSAVVLLAGCATLPKPQAYNIKVVLDPSMVGRSFQVDLIGANKVSDLPKWESYSVTEFWQPDNVVRRDARKATLQFGRGRPDTQVFPANDPRWTEWLSTGALYLVVIADLPGSWTDRPGNADPRRVILPLDKAEWGKADTIEFRIQSSGISLITPKKL
jgi:hypothetical protein